MSVNQIEKERGRLTRELAPPCERSGGLYRTKYDNPTISVFLYHYCEAQGAVAVGVATIFNKIRGDLVFLQE